ncbi:MAG: 5'-3' exonuclease H3TH domain-containing protein, partial [Dehalococcoidia bacterium]
MSTQKNKGRFVILDGHGIIFRAYFAMRDREALMVKRTGELTGAVYGFANTLLRVIDELKPTHIAVAMDTDEPTFRHEADANYKANRPPPPEDLGPQIDRCRDVIEAFNIPIYEARGYEADDVLAALADQAAEQDVETWIATLDSDLIQLVRPGVNVFMYRPYQRDTVRYDSLEKVRDRYGIDPIQMIDFKGLAGDTSDNIPGVPGIGEKGALLLLSEHRTIEEACSELDDEIPKIERMQKDRSQKRKESRKKAKALDPETGETEQAKKERAEKEEEEKAIDAALRLKLRTLKALRDNQEIALHSKQMATIRHDVPVELDLEAAKVHDYDHAAVLELFQELEFRSLIDRLPAPAEGEKATAAGDAVETHYEIIRTVKALKAWLQKARKAPLLALDLETSGMDTMTSEIAGYALAVAPGEAAYVPVNHADDGEALIAAGEAKELLRPLIEDPAIAKVLHNAKFDLKVLAQHGLTLRGLSHDTMLAAYLLGEPAIGLKALALDRLGVQMTPIAELIG